MLIKPKMVPFLPFLSLFFLPFLSYSLSYYMASAQTPGAVFFIVMHSTKEAGGWCSDAWLSCTIHVVKTEVSLLNLIGIKHVLMIDHRLGMCT